MLTNSGYSLYFFPEDYVTLLKLTFHFGIAVVHVFICGFWATLLRRRTLESAVREREMSRLNAKLVSLATTDGLTGLKNHRAYQEAVSVECERARLHETPLSLIVLDVDYFKRFNDLYGHQSGDVTLRQIAQILLANTHTGDTLARYGGEEFVLLMPSTPSDSAVTRALTIQNAIASAEWEFAPVTASFGLATLEERQGDATGLFRDADKALYSSKQNGRNRTTHANSLQTETDKAA